MSDLSEEFTDRYIAEVERGEFLPFSGISYDEDGADIIAEGLVCPECKSRATFKDPLFGNWKCEDCSTVWDESQFYFGSD